MSENDWLQQGIEKGREAARESECPNCGATNPDEIVRGMTYRLRCTNCGYETFGHQFMMATKPYQYDPEQTADDTPPVP